MEHCVIDSTAVIGQSTAIGPFSVIEGGVTIGNHCEIGSHVVIHRGSLIGDHVRIDDHTVIGKRPMRSKRSIFKDEPLNPVQIGNDCLIGAQVVIYAGSELG